VAQPEEEEAEEEQEEVEEEEDEEREGEREEAMGGRGEKFIGGKGWEVLGLFVEMWREDQREHLAKYPNERESWLRLDSLLLPAAFMPGSQKPPLTSSWGSREEERGASDDPGNPPSHSFSFSQSSLSVQLRCSLFVF
jgi:hypothetical protein